MKSLFKFVLPMVLAITLSSVSYGQTRWPRAAVSYGHWSYPGSIDYHLQYEHGVSIAGMSHEQKLALHDALHEGRSSGASRGTQVNAQRPVVRRFRLFR